MTTAKGWAVVGPEGDIHGTTFRRLRADCVYWFVASRSWAGSNDKQRWFKLRDCGYTVQRVEVRVVGEADHEEA